jgi:hypothetical protein
MDGNLPVLLCEGQNGSRPSLVHYQGFDQAALESRADGFCAGFANGDRHYLTLISQLIQMDSDHPVPELGLALLSKSIKKSPTQFTDRTALPEQLDLFGL